MAQLSVVIPVLGRHEALARTLDALEQAEEVVLVADAAEPEPEGVERIAAGRERVRVLRAPRPGASAARNLGWRSASAPVVLFLGADIVARPGMIDRHAAAHEREPQPQVALLGRVRWAPWLRVTPFMRWLDRGVQFDYGGLSGGEASWAHLYTANVSLKTALLERVGGFDEERFPFLYEDLDLGLRLRDHGLVVRYDPEALGEHDHVQTVAGWQGRMAAVARAERAFVERHPDQRAYFRDRLASALAGPPALGLGRPLARWAPPRGRLWAGIDRHYRRRLAPAFLAGWDQAG